MIVNSNANSMCRTYFIEGWPSDSFFINRVKSCDSSQKDVPLNVSHLSLFFRGIIFGSLYYLVRILQTDRQGRGEYIAGRFHAKPSVQNGQPQLSVQWGRVNNCSGSGLLQCHWYACYCMCFLQQNKNIKSRGPSVSQSEGLVYLIVSWQHGLWIKKHHVSIKAYCCPSSQSPAKDLALYIRVWHFLRCVLRANTVPSTFFAPVINPFLQHVITHEFA